MSVAAVENLIKREKTSPSRVKTEVKSSNEILSELFGAFNAAPPEIRESSNKKKRKKDKKHKKEKKRSRRNSNTSSESERSRKHKKKKKKSRHHHRSYSRSLSLSRSRSRSYECKPKVERLKDPETEDDDDVKPKVKSEDIKSEDFFETVFYLKPNGDYKSKSKIHCISTEEEERLPFEIKNEDIDIPLPSNPKFSSDDLRVKLLNKQEDKQGDKQIDEEDKAKTKGLKGIQIKNLKFSAVFEEAVKKAEEEAKKKKELCEEGEYTDSSSNSRETSVDNTSFPKTSDPGGLKKKNKDEKRDKNRSSRDRECSRSKNRHSSDRSRSRRRSQNRIRSHRRSRSRSRSRSHHRSRSRHRSKSRHRSSSHHRSRSHHRSKSHHRSRSRSRRKSTRRSRSRSRDRYRGRLTLGPRKSRSPTGVRLADAEKKRLLEVARRNAINMLKNGAVPAGAAVLPAHTRNQVMAAIQSGGKSVDELTDFCKHLSKKEALGEISSLSEDESENEDTRAFHHPFLVKDKGPIVMNIRGGVPLPVKSGPLAIQNKEELASQFPVSSGTQHRKGEHEWRPVSPGHNKQIVKINSKPASLKPIASSSSNNSAPLALPQLVPPPLPELPAPLRTFIGGNPLPTAALQAPGPQAYPPGVHPPPQPPPPPSALDINSMLDQKLLAIRAESENNHIPASSGMGQFRGSTGANILTPRELASGTQAWAKKDQLTRATPVLGGMGMHLLQKMGWTPGKGLGKEESGTLQPLLLDVKLDTKGLQAREEQKGKNARKNKAPGGLANALSGVSGKHPVSLLGEYCSKRKLGPPEYECCFECGPDHKKNFLFKVRVAGVEYQPSVASANKKQAKADSATLALQKLGVLP